MPSLFEQVVDCCKLAPAFARRLVTQACQRSGAAAETMGPEDLIRALPHIEQALSVFLDPKEVAQKVRAMRRLVQASWPAFPAVRPESQGPPSTKKAS
jgi:hypothetical protein